MSLSLSLLSFSTSQLSQLLILIMKNKLITESRFPLKHFTSVKSCGDMKNGAQRNSLLRSLELDAKNIVLMRQVHGNNVHVAGEKDKGGFIEDCDGLITNENNIMLGIFTADCMPVLMASKDKSVKAAVHAGWKGLASGILQNTIKIFNKKFKVKAEDIVVYIGPHIRECCYEVGAELGKAFGVRLKNNRLNLSETARKILKKEGVKEIHSSRLCTFCGDNLFFSYRRDKTEARILTAINN